MEYESLFQQAMKMPETNYGVFSEQANAIPDADPDKIKYTTGLNPVVTGYSPETLDARKKLVALLVERKKVQNVLPDSKNCSLAGVQ